MVWLRASPLSARAMMRAREGWGTWRWRMLSGGTEAPATLSKTSAVIPISRTQQAAVQIIQRGTALGSGGGSITVASRAAFRALASRSSISFGATGGWGAGSGMGRGAISTTVAANFAG